MIEKLAQGDTSVIGNTILLSEAQTHLGDKIPDDAIKNLQSKSNPALNEAINILKKGPSELDSDGKLASAMQQADNVVMGMQFQLGHPLGKSDKPLPDYVSRNVLSIDANIDSGIYPAISATPPSAFLVKQRTPSAILICGGILMAVFVQIYWL